MESVAGHIAGPVGSIEESAMSASRACSLSFRAVLWAAPCVLGGPAQAADTLSTPGPAAIETGWSRWQGRVGLSSPAGVGQGLAEGVPLAARSSLSLLGDYYFIQNGLAAGDAHGGGFRATGGLFVGPRSGLWLATPATLSALSTGLVTQRRSFGLLSPVASTASDTFDSSSVPYVGVGYTGLKSLRATGGGWAFSADLGVMALQPRSAVRLGQQPVGETLRELQFSPLLQVGASYTF
jgi:hypothetical protein